MKRETIIRCITTPFRNLTLAYVAIGLIVTVGVMGFGLHAVWEEAVPKIVQALTDIFAITGE